MARCLVTGGCGFIGSHLVDKLVKERHKVFVVDDFSAGMDYRNDKAVYFNEDCRNKKSIDAIFKKVKPQVVYHLAANAAENKAQFSPIDITSRNYDAFIKVLTPFIRYGGKRFVFTSSIAVYGALQTPFKETDEPDPEDLYGITKLAAERSLEVMSKVHGFEYVIARPHNVYGPRQNMRDPYRNVVTIFMNQALNEKPYSIYGDGEQKRCFSYIDDVIEALYKCGFNKVSGKTFNIGSDKYYTINDLVAHVSTLTKWYYGESLPERIQEVKEAISDHTLAKRLLRYKDTTSLKKGLRETWRWAKKQGPQNPKYTEIEIQSKKLPENWL